jgi:signal transduction histidine kinase
VTEGDPGWSRWRRPRPTAAERWRDIWVALAVFAGGVIVLVLVNSMGAFAFGDAPSLAEQLAWALALCAPLAVRRRYPLVVLIVVSVMFVAAQIRHIGDNNTPSVALFFAVYTVGAWEPNRVVARWSRIGVIVFMGGWLIVSLFDAAGSPLPDFPDAAGPLDPWVATVLYQLVFNFLYFFTAYWFGNSAWLSARRQAQVVHQSEELRRSQERDTHGAIVAERLRIARDLHDVVAHHVSVMGVQAGAARRALDRDQELAREALQTVERTARTAIGELRALLGVLRADEGPAAAHEVSPGLEQLEELVAGARAAGLEVRHGVYGDPRPVPDGVALSAYRVVQEALTNVVKHAGARSAEVRIRYLEHVLEVEVTDDGRGPSRTGTGGFGLVGMRERVAVHGGELEAGPRRGAGYRVRASLPVGGDR